MKQMKQIAKISVPTLIALCLVNFAYMADMAIVPAAEAIFEEFAQAPISLLNFILSGPQLIGIFSALLMTVLMKRLPKRTLILGMFTLFCVVSCASTLILNAYYLAVMRALTGFAGGGLTTVALALIHELCGEDHSRCEQYEGVFNGFCALAGTILSLAAGILCVGGWTHVFRAYYAAVPMLIFMFFAIPKTQNPTSMQNNQKAERVRVNLRCVAPLLLSLLVLNTLAMMMSYQASIYVAQTDLGGSVLAGVVSGVYTIATAIACVASAPVYARLQRKMAPLIYALMALAYLGCSFAISSVWLCACVFLLGISYGFAQTYFLFYGPSAVSEPAVPAMIGWIAAMNGLGAFLCTFVSTLLSGLFQITALNRLCLLYAVLLAVGCAISAYLALQAGRNRANVSDDKM